MNLRHIQEHQPWTVPYSRGVQEAAGGLVPHILASHDVLHAAKTVGKLAAVFEELDHSKAPMTAAHLRVVQDMAADLVVEALRLANLHHFDLEFVLLSRIAKKNGVTIPAEGS